VTIFQVGMTQQLEEIEDLTKPAQNSIVNLASERELRELEKID